MIIYYLFTLKYGFEWGDMMGNMITYARSFLDSFEQSPFNEVDSLILSWLSYLRYPYEISNTFNGKSVCIRDVFCAELFGQLTRNIWFPKKTMELLTAVAANPRFRHIKILRYEHETNGDCGKQFAAVTFELSSDLHYVAYRGTDDTFVGWREDFYLASQKPILSQLAAVNYLETAASALSGSLIVGGHSKGGNLAVYASAMCRREVQNRISAVYSHDGPGFHREFLECEGFMCIKSVIHKTLPKSSFVGMMFCQECDYKIVKSDFASLVQHVPFYWKVDGNRFCFEKHLTVDARFLYKCINRWIVELNDSERERFINEVFDILNGANTSEFIELISDLRHNVPIIGKRIVFLSTDTKIFFIKMYFKLLACGIRSIPEAFERNITVNCIA